MKWLILIGILLGNFAAKAFECQDTAEGFYSYQDSILASAQRNLSAKEFKREIEQPLHCLLQSFKNEGGLARYVAGACLRRLFGGPEIQGFHRGKNYELVLKKLIAEQIRQKDLFKNSELSIYAVVEWEEYQPFCQGIVAESDCFELLPDSEQVQAQSELLGASSMLILRSAYRQFSGEAKSKVEETILKLRREIPKKDFLKRKVIEEIYQEMQQPLLLKKS